LYLYLSLSYSRYRHHLNLYFFPTRRSSDLIHLVILSLIGYISLGFLPYLFSSLEPLVQQIAKDIIPITMYITPIMTNKVYKTERSEEHTSELQSRFDLVCRLLLEKKKKKKN